MFEGSLCFLSTMSWGQVKTHCSDSGKWKVEVEEVAVPQILPLKHVPHTAVPSQCSVPLQFCWGNGITGRSGEAFTGGQESFFSTISLPRGTLTLYER